MERIHATVCVRTVGLDALGDPLCAVSGHDPDGCALFFRQFGEEQLEHFLAMAVVRPDDRVGVVVDDHRDVCVAFPVACLVDSDVDESVQPFLRVRLQIVPDELHETAYGLPVDLQPLRDLCLVEPTLEHPRGGIGEVCCESRAWLRPGDGCGADAVNGT